MREILKRTGICLVTLFMAFALLQGVTMEADAAAKKTTYSFSSCDTSKFTLKNGKLTIKAKGLQVSYKVAKSCKWRVTEVDRKTIKTKTYKSSYKKIKGYINFDRKWYKKNHSYNNVFMSKIVVQNKKIIKVEYFSE